MQIANVCEMTPFLG